MKYLKPTLYVLFGGASLALCRNGDLLRIVLGVDPGPALAGSLALLLLGMLVITHGGDLFTDSAVAIARATRIPPVIVGGTLVSLATTFPEFMVSFTGALRGQPEFAVGNALGSCCVNIGLIVGFCALLNGWMSRGRDREAAIPINRVTILGPGLFMLGAGVLVYAFSWFDTGGLTDDAGEPLPFAVSRWQGAVLFLIFIGYLLFSLRIAYLSRYEIRGREEEQEAEEIREHLGVQSLVFLAGAGLVILGSRVLISNAAFVAEEMGVPKLWIGLTVLALGTSLPEFTISVLAVVKQHGSLGLGNIIGANVLNIGWVVATCSLWAPLRIQRQTVLLDAPLVLVLMALLLAGAYRKERVSWRLGAALFGVYVAYFGLVAALFGSGG